MTKEGFCLAEKNLTRKTERFEGEALYLTARRNMSDRGGYMRLLFELDKKDYASCTRSYVRNSARSIILSGGRIAMVHSLKYDYYKFPGGGIEAGESPVDALIRETREEAGLAVIPASIREYGYVHRVQKSTTHQAERFVQDNYYYLCEVEERVGAQKLDDYESEERFTLEYVEPELAIRINRAQSHGPKEPLMIEREAMVLEMLIAEGYFGPRREAGCGEPAGGRTP